MKKKDRLKKGMIPGIYGIISNSVIGISKIIIGVLSGSISIIVDAFNNIFDMTSSILTILAFKLSGKKADKEHPYGHARYEYLFSMFIAIIMLFTGSLFLYKSIMKIIYPEELNINTITFIILIFSIIVKLSQAFVYMHYYKKIKSSALKYSALDTRNDIIITTSVLISMIVIKYCNYNIDGYISFIISIFIIISSIKMLLDSIHPLLGITPSKELVKTISKKISSHDKVLGIHDLIIHNYGVDCNFISVHIDIDSKLSLLEAHDIADDIENDIKETMGSEINIHMDPVVVGDKKTEELKNLVSSTLKELNNDIEIHDFRIVKRSDHDKIMFDAVIPFEEDYTYQDLCDYLEKNIDSNNTYRIEIERPYV